MRAIGGAVSAASMALRSQIIGCGAYLPERIVTNDDLAARLDTSDEWIRQRTGIGERRVAADGELTSDLAVRAAERALAAAGMSGSDLDLIVLATATPDNTFPATATKVQARLGMHRGAAFDVQAVCAGFIFALAAADNALRLGQARTALVIGAETFSRILDWDDRGTCVLFGDGAGALVLQAVPTRGRAAAASCRPICIPTDANTSILYVDGGPSSTAHAPASCAWKGARSSARRSQHLGEVVDEALAANGLDRGATSTGWCRIRPTAGSSTGWAKARPAARQGRRHDRSPCQHLGRLDPAGAGEAVGDGRIRPGQLVLMEAMGGGLTWGAALVRW